MMALLLLGLAAPADADDPLPRHAVTRLGTSRFRLDGAVSAVAVSPDGRRAATPGLGGTVFWDAATGREVGRCRAGGCVAYSPDGRTLAAGGWADRGQGQAPVL